MKIKFLSLHNHEFHLTIGQKREVIFINIIDQEENSGWGEIAPLPKWSQETLEEALHQITQKKKEIMSIDWTPSNCLEELKKLNLLPSVSFGLESALLSFLQPISEKSIHSSALLMGSTQEIILQANKRIQEGFVSAKLKVSNLNFDEAVQMIDQLKNKLRLRIDVNRAWNTSDSLNFFKQFSIDAFEYVEEPFQKPEDLRFFTHPLAIDESFPADLSLDQLEILPTLKALIYKPTIQGGLTTCFPLHEWCKKKNIDLILSSSFESKLGLSHIALMARRLGLSTLPGLGTYHYLK